MKNTICEKLIWDITRGGTILNFLAKEFSEDEIRAIKLRFRTKPLTQI